MDLPPPTYFLLLGVTLVAYPFVLRAARSADSRAVARHVLQALVLLEAALVLLFYSRLVCWLLAGTAALVLAAAGPGRWSRAFVATEAALALVAGLAFQFLPGSTGFVVYFLWGLPVLFGLPLARLVASWLRYDHAFATWLAGAAVLLFAGWFVVSAFLLDFLQRFEVAHLVVAALSLAALAFLVGPGWSRRQDARRSALATADPARYLARPVHGRVVAVGGAWLVMAVLVATAALGSAGTATYAAFAAGTVGTVAVAAVVRSERTTSPVRHVLLALGTLVFVAPLVALWPVVATAYVTGAAPIARGALVAGGATTTLGLLAFAAAWSVARELAARVAVAEADTAPPAEAPRERLARAPDVGTLERFANGLAAHGAVSGVLVVSAPPDPLWTLPDDVHDWLVSQRDPDRRVHVAIEASDGVYVIPEVWPEETDA